MINIAIGIAISLVLYNKSCAPDCPLKWNQITLWNDRVLHLHHWFLSAALLPFAKNELIRGILIGGILHGVLAYDDWYVFMRPA